MNHKDEHDKQQGLRSEHDDHTGHIHHSHHDEQLEKETHEHEHHHHGNFKELFLKSLPLGIVVLVLSPMMGIDLPFSLVFLIQIS